MRYAIFLLAFAVSLWPSAHYGVPVAYADTATATSTATNTAANQDGAQNNNQANNNQGSSDSAMLGMMAIAGGMAMMAAGMSMMSSPPTAGAGAALMAAGAMMLMMGMQAMAASQQMANNAAQSGNYGNDMSSLSSATATSIAPVQIDPSLTHTPAADLAMNDFEQKTGISREALVDALNSGADPASLLASSPTVQAAGGTPEQIQNALDQAKSAEPLSNSDLMDKLGMSQADLAQMAKDNAAYNASGGGARSPSSLAAGTPDFNFNGGKDSLIGSSSLGGNGSGKNGNLSNGVQAALDRSGVTNLSLFQMVTRTYKRKTPMMFGDTLRKVNSQGTNPFSDLANDKVNL